MAALAEVTMSRDARRILLLAIAVGVVVDVTTIGHAAGLNAAVVIAALLASAVAVAGPAGLRRVDPADGWMPVAALVLAAMAAVRADPWLVSADLVLASALALGTIAALAGARITRGAVPRVIDAAGAVVAALLMGAVVIARRPPTAGSPSDAAPAGRDAWRARLAPWRPVLRGLLLATPIVLLFALLFASADAVFAGLVSDLLRIPIAVDLDDLAERAVVILGVAWLVAGLLALCAGLLPLLIPGRPPEPESFVPPPARSLGAASAADMARNAGTLGSIEAATILVAVDLLFAGFLVLQFTYLFGDRDTLAVAGMTYADYARRGFFELVFAAVLAGMLVVCLDLAVRWRSRLQVAAALALLALTGLVLVSAFVRLRLYQDAYGWTELRFVVIVAIGWLAAALAVTAGLVVTRRTSWTLHALGILAVVTVVGMNLVGPQAYVADRNLERAMNASLVPPGGRSGLDGAYLMSLGDEAIPAVVAAYDRLQPADRRRLDRFLAERRIELDVDPALRDWPSFNLARERARASLATWDGPR
jgi:hypothetical protein